MLVPLPDGIPSPRITGLRVRNYRVLRDVTLTDLTPLAGLLGPNGSGKSTLFDAIRLLSEAVTDGIGAAWGQRGGIAELRTRGAVGPVVVEVSVDVVDRFDYSLAIDEDEGRPVIVEERLSVWPDEGTEAVPVLRFSRGTGTVYRGGRTGAVKLTAPDVLAVALLGQLAEHPLVAQFRQFVAGWRLANLDVEQIRAGSGRRTGSLSSTGDNLGHVIQHLQDEYPDRLAQVVDSLRRYVPGLEGVRSQQLADGRQIVRIKDRDFDEPILPGNVSEGTLKLLAYLIALLGSAEVLLLEEPENYVHPRLHQPLAEDIRMSADSGQVIVATHSPYFVDALRPEEVWAFFRGRDGYAQVRRAADLPRLMPMVESGGALGALWSEGYFGVGDPLAEPS